MIELGRYNNRNCPFFGSSQTEDDIHFLYNCSKYSLIGNNFYKKVKILFPNITQLPVNTLINEMMNTSNSCITLQFMKFISACFDFRDELLTKQFNWPAIKY